MLPFFGVEIGRISSWRLDAGGRVARVAPRAPAETGLRATRRYACRGGAAATARIVRGTLAAAPRVWVRIVRAKSVSRRLQRGVRAAAPRRRRRVPLARGKPAAPPRPSVRQRGAAARARARVQISLWCCPHRANTTTAEALAAEIVATARVSDHVESLGKERRVVLVYDNDRGDAIVQREAGVSFCEPLESVITDQGWTIEHVIPGARGAAAPGSAPGVRGPIADGRVGSTFIVLSRPKQRAT